MRRAYWSADFAEAHIVEATLRAHGVQAWVFDALLMRQDWFRILMFGGYRVMVADEDAARAADLIGEYRAGALAITDDAVERPTCPKCTTPGRDDPAPQRFVFMLLIAGYALFVVALLALRRDDDAIMALAWTLPLVVAPIVAVVLTHRLKGRYFCPQCTTSWRTRPVPFATMARDVDAAARGESRP